MPAAPDNGDRMYRRLQVPPEASSDQIRHAYRRLAHDLHPDTHPEDPEASQRFREITEAYDILSSAEGRARYDRSRRQAATAMSWPTSTGRGGSGQAAGGTPQSRPFDGGPTVIGVGRFPAAWPPLVAGPVRIAPPRVSSAERRRDPTPDEFSRLVEAVLSWWRSY